MPNYTNEQLRQLYQRIPQEIKDLCENETTTETITSVCEQNGITDQRFRQISDLIRNVLFGLLPPTEFVPALEKEAGLDKDLAKKIGQEINRFVFFPVKESLAQLYQINNVPEQNVKANQVIPKTQQGEEMPAPPTEQEKADTYREPIE